MKKQIKEIIVKQFKKNSDYSFPELINELKKEGISVEGDQALLKAENLIIWDNMNTEFIESLLELEKDEILKMEPLSKANALMVYAYSGVTLDLPIADRIEPYSTPHWIPAIIKKKA